MKTQAISAAVLALLSSSTFGAQTTVVSGPNGTPTPIDVATGPAFEVASVKPSESGAGRMTILFQPGGRLSVINMPLRTLVAFAYGAAAGPLPPFRILGGPDWMASRRFDIAAKAEGNPPPGPNGPLPVMLRTLLADRFKLAVHTDTRELPIYALTLAASDRRFGPQLRPSNVDCDAVRAARRGQVGGPPQPPPLGERPTCGMFVLTGRISGGSMTMAEMSSMLTGQLARTVTDKTGLTGRFDFDLEFAPDQLPQGPPPAGAPPLPPIDPNGPSIFTAMQEQLGLKLESQRGPVEVLVIDHVEPPTPD